LTQINKILATKKAKLIPIATSATNGTSPPPFIINKLSKYVAINTPNVTGIFTDRSQTKLLMVSCKITKEVAIKMQKNR
jgi:hypothetical protein